MDISEDCARETGYLKRAGRVSVVIDQYPAFILMTTSNCSLVVDAMGCCPEAMTVVPRFMSDAIVIDANILHRYFMRRV